jgi:hypothetical protein
MAHRFAEELGRRQRLVTLRRLLTRSQQGLESVPA